MSHDARGAERFRPRDECPLFSDRLEEHLVAVTRGETPNRGRFCGQCYTPLAPDSALCPHCGEPTSGLLPPVDLVPAEVLAMLQAQRKTERWIVNGFAYLGLTLAVVVGLVFVLAVPFLRESLIWATVVYATILVLGGRTLAGVLGGYYGDRLAYERGRRHLRAQWAAWVETRGG